MYNIKLAKSVFSSLHPLLYMRPTGPLGSHLRKQQGPAYCVGYPAPGLHASPPELLQMYGTNSAAVI